MQNIFLTKQKPENYVDKNGDGKYTEAPGKCPYGDWGSYHQQADSEPILAQNLEVRRHFPCLL